MKLQIDSQPWQAYALAPLAVAQWADQVFDWLEQDPVNPHALVHVFSGPVRAVFAQIDDRRWMLLWSIERTEVAVVRHLGLRTL